ncbi:SDR family oxidoreductase [Clavibacter sp. VKM Ac-2873]|uniref:SDR family oxidoreductase n=1 Tax=Clavibacter sp. VKM Ac-2873 TaxID=2783813 RepID=UPI00188B6B66|nr:SDR family oxidoreductase [Clavibacter sp. VKM Ac-2873]MBF4617201.1 SDR family oxidoreductase [Clavibacter sp. VKM Ac-2873]
MGGSSILVTGATGEVAGRVVTLLAERGDPVRALCRRPEQVEAFRARGIDAVLGDLGDTGSLRRAMEGCDRVFLLTPVTPRQAALGRNAVEAATAVGIRRVVHLSGGDAALDSPLPWAKACAETDALLRASDLDWTLVRPSAFMQNVLESAPAIRRGVYPQTTGASAIGWIDPADIARVVAQVLTEDGHVGRDHVLTGPEALTSRQIAERLSTALGRRIRYVHLPGPVFGLALRAAGADAWLARGLVTQYARVVRDGLDEVRAMTDTVQEITGTPPRSFLEFARAHAEELRRG